ncbi:MAG TPA: deoxyribodipyrimidine photo-lyase [Candidatus Paceibacterota bacterium]|nr:deoxyribodipyrimidine photo-lyase [Candidatus Paceibacterota bacterium]HMP85048.1 deoxyribodipyrimidine photo-lyase [Candidatus Paceibacterota bacterium]
MNLTQDLLKNGRATKLNDKEPSLKGPIIYWMNREMRLNDNWSLLFAKSLAEQNKTNLILCYNLVTNFLGSQNRQFEFKKSILSQIKKDLSKTKYDFFVLEDENGQKTADLILNFCKKNNASGLVTDFSPLKICQNWNLKINQKITIPFFEIDSHNIVPTKIASDKKEFAAYTFRPKIYKKLSEFLIEYPKSDFDSFHNTSAQKVLNEFLNKKLQNYATDRNNPNISGQSDFSPFLHFGVLSSQRITLEICKKVNLKIEQILSDKKNKAKVNLSQKISFAESAGAFLEELIVRKELSDNFCFYEKNYDNFSGFPDWAKKTLNKSKKDKREYVYSKKQFELAKTHDDLWNACQMQMIKSGKMHGYLRMYWAKKILEWSKGPEDALEIAIYLNDKYEMDGRDPNGYAGIAWSIGGVHDRPWFDRPIFGQIRYMALSGCQKKFDVKKYIKNWKN